MHKLDEASDPQELCERIEFYWFKNNRNEQIENPTVIVNYVRCSQLWLQVQVNGKSLTNVFSIFQISQLFRVIRSLTTGQGLENKKIHMDMKLLKCYM